MAPVLRLHGYMTISRKIWLATCMAALFPGACRQKAAAPVPIAMDRDTVRETVQATVDTIYSGNADTTLTLMDKKAVIVGHIAANTGKPAYTVRGVKGQTLVVLLNPVKKGGNVRINQIRQPGGAFDGPFGDSLRYTFKRTGDLSIIIGENLMAGDPYNGNFVLRLRVE
jgi:hypothetical protein